LPEALELLSRHVGYGVILSTCNRTEVYASGDAGRPLEESMIQFFNELTGVSCADLLPHLYLKRNSSACGHLFRVASGLDSMIIGEYEILGQISQALEAARAAETVNQPLGKLFVQAVNTGRRVRDETDISRNALSVSSVAVDLARSALGRLENTCVLIVGAGEAGRLVARAAIERGAQRTIICSRSPEKARRLAGLLDTDEITDDMLSGLSIADIVVSCTSAPHAVIEYDMMAEAMRRRGGRAIVLVDIAVPRDIEPKVKMLEGVNLYNLDDLSEISSANRSRRQKESLKAMEIIREEADRYLEWWQSLEVKPTVSALIQKAEDIRKNQLELTVKKLPPMSPEQLQSLEAMTRSIVTRVLHDPIAYLKQDARNKTEYSSMVSEIFRLNGEKVKQ
jgi:glutamyl-tRNA reductase